MLELEEELISNCREVLLICGGRQVNGDEWRGSMLGLTVARGRRYMGCVVRGVKPELEDASTDACIVYRGTTVRVANVSRVQVLEQDEETTIVKHGGKVYVYPTRVIREIENEYIKPIAQGQSPLNPGLLLIGQPGVGKTSMIEILADSVGFNKIKVISTQVLDKYVGESERKLERIIERAIEEEPSVVIIDDVEWLIRGREMSGESEGWRYSLFQVLADGIDRIRNEQRAVLIAASTNINPEVVDIAMRRHGRFGEPKVIPPPTPNMVAKWITYAAQYVPWIKELANREGLDKVREFAMRAAYGGNSMTEIENALEKWWLEKDEKPKSLTSPTSGFRRVFMSKLVQNDVTECIKNTVDMIVEASGKVILRPVINIMQGAEALLEALLANSLTMLKQVALVPTDSMKVRETLTMAKLLGASVIVNEWSIIERYPVDVLEAPVPVFIATTVPQPYASSLPVINLFPCTTPTKTMQIQDALQTLVRVAAEYYGVHTDERKPIRLGTEVSDAVHLVKLAQLMRNMKFPDVNAAVSRLTAAA
jgi:hypothetical protein